MPSGMAEGLKLGLYGLHRGGSADPDTLVRRAHRAEEAGFESLWVGDHVALPHGPADPPAQPRLEALVALTYMAALTTSLVRGAVRELLRCRPAAAAGAAAAPELGELEITVNPSGVVDLDTARRYADLGVHRLAGARLRP
jgi:hypothetical protein